MMFYERASGARMHANYFRVGGVHQDLPPKLIDDIWNFCDPFLKVCDDLEVLLTEDRDFQPMTVDRTIQQNGPCCRCYGPQASEGEAPSA
jgi:NADH-quinone oxidoreductase subunit D